MFDAACCRHRLVPAELGRLGEDLVLSCVRDVTPVPPADAPRLVAAARDYARRKAAPPA